jgi:hypothetical protein
MKLSFCNPEQAQPGIQRGLDSSSKKNKMVSRQPEKQNLKFGFCRVLALVTQTKHDSEQEHKASPNSGDPLEDNLKKSRILDRLIIVKNLKNMFL